MVFVKENKIVKYCIIILNWDSLVVMLSIGCFAGEVQYKSRLSS